MKNVTKKIVSALLIAVMLWTYIFSVAPLPTLYVSAATTATTTDYVNLRTGAGTSYSVITTVAKGASLTVLDTNNSSWYKVKTAAGSTGYMSSAYIKVSTSSTTTGNTGTATDYVNLRTGAGTGYSVVATISTGSALTILDSSNSSWYKVRTSSGREGYMSSAYIKISSASSPGGGQAPSETSVGTATTKVYLNLRSGAGTSSSIITTLALGVQVTLLDVSNSAWYKVKTASGRVGYLSAEYLSAKINKPAPQPKPAPPSDESVGTAKTTDYVNLRKGAGTSYSIITTLSLGANVTLLDVSNSHWYKVKTASGAIGYLSTSYIKADINNTNPEAPGDSSAGTATTKVYLNLRSGAGTSYSIITTLATGVQVTLLDISNTAWYKVKTASGSIGYLSSEYLNAKINTPSAPVAEITLAAGSASLTLGDVYQLKATVKNNADKTPAAASSDENVASVAYASNSSGVYVYSVTAKKAGSATITLSIGNVSKTFTVNVTQPEVIKTPEIILAASECTLSAEQTFELQATVKNKGENEVKATSSNPAVASVSFKAVSEDVHTFTVVANEIGSAKITVQVGTVKKDFTVSVMGYAKTTTALNFRKGKSLDSEVITVLSSGTYLTVLDVSDVKWIKVKTNSGIEGYVYLEYITYVSGNTGSITLSLTKANIPAGKTMYNKATAKTSSSGFLWYSDDESIATVSDGYIYGVAPGYTKVYAKDISGENIATCNVTIEEPESVRFVYSAPNIVGVGSETNAVAITGDQPSKVKFVVEYSSSDIQTFEVTAFTEENRAADGELAETKTRVWQQALVFDKAGKYNVWVYSATGEVWSDKYKAMTIYVTESESPKVATYGQRRASDAIISNIKTFEGFCPVVYPDTLAYDIPTLGYGYVLSVGEVFYNNLTERSAWAMLCNTVNEKTYTTEVNKMVANNNFKISQAQFDALVCFSYNVGAGYWNNLSYDCLIRDYMLNAVDVTQLDFTLGGYLGKMIVTASVYANLGDTSAAATVNSGTAVKVVDAYTNITDTKNEVWYKIDVGGKLYWARNVYIKLDNIENFVRDLTYIDGVAIGTQFIQWHVAGGVCLPGLLYRRLAEAKVFTFANYDEAKMSSPKYRVNTYGYFYPSCLAKYEQ